MFHLLYSQTSAFNEISRHWYCYFVRNEQSQRFELKFVRNCTDKYNRLIEIIWQLVDNLLFCVFISHKFKQILMQNVDSVHFSQNANISGKNTVHEKIYHTTFFILLCITSISVLHTSCTKWQWHSFRRTCRR